MNGDALVKKTTKIMFGDAGISGTAQYMSQLVWVLFLKVFDYKEEEWELEEDYEAVIPSPFRFRDWADPKKESGEKDYSNRLTGEHLIDFVNNNLFPFLQGKELKYNGKTIRFVSEDSKAYIVREFMSESQNYMKDGVRLRQLIDEIAEIDFDQADQKHDFNDFYEKLLKELQNGGKATGEFYTPRAVTKFITDHVDPQIGERVADFACGTGGFLAEAISHMQKKAKTVDDNETIQKSIYGIEWKQLPYMLAITNMLLHNIDNPQIKHDDGLNKNVLDLSESDLFDCILMNPPFGGEFNKADLTNFPNDLASSESADLFVARIIYCLKKNGRCGLVLPDGLLFNIQENAKVALKKKLLDECNLHTIIRLPQSVFAPYASIATNLLFFDKTGKTKEVWYYRMDMPKGKKHFSKTKPILRSDFEEIDQWWDNRHEIKDEGEDYVEESWKSKKYTYEEIEARGFEMNLCGYPKKEDKVVSPDEAISEFILKKNNLERELAQTTENLEKCLHGDITVQLRNIKEINDKLVVINQNFPEQMKRAVLLYAMEGHLTCRLDSDSSVVEIEKKLVYDSSLPKITAEDIPFEIPDSWRWIRIGNLSETADTNSFSDGPFGSNLKREHQIPDPEVRIIQLSNIGENGWRDENVKYTSYEHLKTISRCEVHAGDFVIAKMMPAGRTIQVPDLGTKICLGSDAVKFVPNKVLNKEFLLYAMKSHAFLQQIRTHGMTRERTSLTKIKTYMLPIPPIEEQARIVERLDNILPYLA